MGMHGSRYIHIHVPCPLGWGAASHDTIRLARLAIETGLFPIFEAEHGRVTHVRKIRKAKPVADYLNWVSSADGLLAERDLYVNHAVDLRGVRFTNGID